MFQSYDFLIARANDAASEAQDAVLDNVKQRALRSEKMWRALAARTRKIERQREKVLLEKEPGASSNPQYSAPLTNISIDAAN